jgi:hypothetical protein
MSKFSLELTIKNSDGRQGIPGVIWEGDSIEDAYVAKNACEAACLLENGPAMDVVRRQWENDPSLKPNRRYAKGHGHSKEGTKNE